MPRDHPRQRGQSGKKKKNTLLFTLSPTLSFSLSPTLSVATSGSQEKVGFSLSLSLSDSPFPFSDFHFLVFPISYFLLFRFLILYFSAVPIFRFPFFPFPILYSSISAIFSTISRSQFSKPGARVSSGEIFLEADILNRKFERKGCMMGFSLTPMKKTTRLLWCSSFFRHKVHI